MLSGKALDMGHGPHPDPCQRGSCRMRRLLELDGLYPQSSNVLRMLGYFSLVGLMRVHCLVGDYYAALKVRNGAVVDHRKCLAPSLQ